VLDKLFGGIAGLLVDVEISITDRRDAVYSTEFDCLISAEPQHRVGDLSAALLSLRGGVPGGPGGPGGWQEVPPGLWQDEAQLDPSAPLASSGLRAGTRLGFGGPPPVGSSVPPPDPASCCYQRNRHRWRGCPAAVPS